MRRDPSSRLNACTQNLLDHSLENRTAEDNPTAIQYEQIWTVIPLSVPKIIRQCPRCHKDKFCSSDKFRVNANKKVIDAWLIYKCVQCEFTWKNSIIKRTPVSKIDRVLFKRLQENDKTLVWQIAFDPNFIQKGISIDWDIDFHIQTQENHFPNSTPECNQKIKFLIQTDYYLKIPIFQILRNKMETSRTQLEKMHQEGILEIYTLKKDTLTLKANLGKGCIVVSPKT